MFGADDEDEDFLAPTGGAKLASLFGVDQRVSQANESFQYTAPKQPRKSSTSAPAAQKSAPPPGAPAVLFGTAVQAFRYINGQYVKQGKLGLAVLGNYTTKEFTLLLYLSQQKQVTAAKIHMGFMLTVQPNSYCTFYDDQRQNWSMMFDSEKALTDFCKEICLAKANNAASLDTVVAQDLSLGDGQAVKNGDSVELLYTGWLLQNHTTGEMFDSNHNTGKLMRLKLGAGKAIKGLEDGMLGMKKSGRRLLIIPPSLAYGSKGAANHALASSTLIFEAELCRVKFFRDSEPDHPTSAESAAPSPAPAPAPSPAPSTSSLSTEPPLQPTTLGPELPGQPQHCENPHSLSEQQTNPDATKAKLISRMAKMGQPMFPFFKEAASHPESSDSELEDMSNNRLKNQLAAPSPVHISTSAPASAHSVPAVVSVSPNVPSQPGMFGSSHAFQAYPYAPLITSSQLHPAGPIHPVQTIPYMGDVTSFLMTEARQHNTEIRQSIGKVADKVDQLTSKMDILERQGSLFMGSSSVSMETSVIMHNIQRIVKENECLKRELLEKGSCIEKQNCTITELITQNQRYMEQSDLILENRNNFLRSSNEQCQARLLEAEQEKSRLMEDLVSSKAQLSQLRLEASTQKEKAAELQTKLVSVTESSESESQRIAGLETQLKEAVGAAELSKAQHRLEKQRCEELECRVHKMQEELHKLQTDKERLGQVALKEKEGAQTRAEQQHRGELAKAAEERDALRDKLAQLQDKYTVSEQHWITAKKKLERKMVELEDKAAQEESSGDTTAKVKQVMNGVFRSLRGEFDVSESYSGQAVMEVIFSTIKNVTLQLLTGSERSSPSKNGEEKDVKQSEDASRVNTATESKRGMKEGRVSESYMETAKEEKDGTAESNVNVRETAAPGPELQQQEGERSAAAAAAEEAAAAAAEAAEVSPGENSADSENPDKSEADLNVHDEPVGEVNATSPGSFTPPPNPPPNPPPAPPPTTEPLEDSCTRLTGEVCDKSKEVSPPSAPSKEAEDDEMSLKGRPPSTSMFGDDDDDNDAGWLD